MTHDALQRRHRHLLWRITRRYQTVTETIRVGPLEIPFTRIADPDRVLDQVAAQEDLRERLEGRRLAGQELHLPYWAELWESALGLAIHLVNRETGASSQGPGASAKSSPPVAAQVLDLGCGMGLAGTAAARLGAHVLFADMEPDALLFARLNSLPDATRVRTHRLDWRRQQLDQRFDLILGADILYDKTQWEHLERFWRAHLTSTGQIFLAEPGRQSGQQFIEWIDSHGWRLQVIEQPVPTRDTPIRLIQLNPR